MDMMRDKEWINHGSAAVSRSWGPFVGYDEDGNWGREEILLFFDAFLDEKKP